LLSVYINGRFLSQHITGVQRYAFELVRGIDRLLVRLPDLNDRIVFTLLAPPNTRQFAIFNHINVKQVGRLTGHMWEQFELPLFSRDGLLVCLCNTGPLLKCNQIVTLCDASVFRVPKAYSFAFRMWYRTLFAIIGRRARGVLTISNFSRNELITCSGIPPHKFTVTYPGINHQNWGKIPNVVDSDKFQTGRPYILAVSSMSPHKNFRALVDAITLLDDADFDVLIAGGANPAIFKCADIPLPKSVKYLGYISDDQLKYLYSKAECFVYPSLYEGFGLPPLEAMSNGCPVIAANAGALPEVCGDAVLYCDPQSPQDIADKIKMMMSNPKLREKYRAMGISHASMYTWEKCARETLDLIKKVLVP